jgi:3-hydroxy-3-methylglutaryl CoA synthase
VICAVALALRPDIMTADFDASLKSGTSALISACDAVRAENINNFLVCAADSRQGKPGSNMEHMFGDGAAAFVVGKEDVIAELKGSHFVSRDFIDHRRMQEERFIHGWEARWIKDEGYVKIIQEAVTGFLEKYSMKIGDFARVAIGCPVGGVLKELSKKLGIEADRLQDNLMGNVGDTGSALAPMMLVAALEEAKPGDRILVAGYGSGCDVLFFEVTGQIEKTRDRMAIKGHLSQKAALDNYVKYLVFRDLIPVDVGIRGEETPIKRMSMMYREGEGISALF